VDTRFRRSLRFRGRGYETGMRLSTNAFSQQTITTVITHCLTLSWRRALPLSSAKIITWVLTLLASLASANAALPTTLTASLPSAQPVGTTVVWSAVTGGATSPLYRFLVAPIGGQWRILQDYGPSATFYWTSIAEGAYKVAVQVIDSANTANSGQAGAQFQLNSRVTSATPVVSPTAHPLVALYSAPPCSGFLRVYFAPASGAGPLMATNFQPCQAGKSVNFYIAGMYPNSTHNLLQILFSGGTTTRGPVLKFQTGGLPSYLATVTLISPPNASTDTAQGVMMVSDYSGTNPLTTPFATDLNGNIIWYAPVGDPQHIRTTLMRPVAGGTFLGTGPASNGVLAQVFKEVDLAGNVVRQTNVGALNMQLASMGKDQVSWLSHEGLRLANGHTLTFGSVERLLSNVQGPGVVDVVGDLIMDLDVNFQVTWTWSSFDFQDATRKATLGETCTPNNGCGQLRLAGNANDWTHGNSIRYLPADGSLVVSQRNQDWVIKIDYGNGTGTGTVLWRLGKGGDFTVVSSDPWPWFSHQHDFAFDGTNYEVYDNGNTRYAANGYTGDSRGQVWSLDEPNRIATLVLNIDLGAFSPIVGTAQHLANGNYQFLNGDLQDAHQQPLAEAIEVLPDGTKNLTLDYNVNCYRVFRMADLYSYNP
jgi:arylsulfate sulfotransferase